MSQRSKVLIGSLLLAMAILIGVGIAIVPRFIEDAYHGHAHPWLNGLIQGQEGNSIQHYVDLWFSLFSWTSALLFVAAGGIVASFRWAGPYFSSNVDGESALAVPILRVVVFFALGVNMLWEDLPSVVHLPSEVRSEMGVMRILHLAHMWDAVYESAVVLWFIKLVGAASCLSAMAGLWSRVTIPVGAVLAILHGGILREFSHSFHTCLLPIYLASAFVVMGLAHNCFLNWVYPRKRGGVSLRSMEVGAMTDTRYRDMLHKSKDQQQAFFDAVGRRANDLQHARKSGGDEIVAFEVERKRWNFLTDPNNQEFGHVVETDRFSVHQ